MELKPKDRIPHDPLGQVVPRGTIYLRAHEAAQYCRCGKTRLFRWERRGLLPRVVDPDGRRFYRVVDLDRVMVEGAEVVETKEGTRTTRAMLPQRPTTMATLPYTEPRTKAKTRLPADRANGGGQWQA